MTTRARPNRAPKAAKDMRAIIYRRISKDDTGEEAGVTRQDKDCREFCARKGWTIIANIVDDDISASSYARKRRPGYQQAIKLIEAGEADALVAYHLDRLWRQPKELEHLVDLVEQHHVIVATLSGDVDLSTGDGRLNARIQVSVAAKASDDISRRVLRVKNEMALEGIPAAAVCAFGWNRAVMEGGAGETKVRKGPRGGMEVVPEEAAAIRDGARRFLAGETLNSIARRWDDAGLATAHGAPGWNGGRVREVLGSPRNAGLRSHRGEIIGKAAWPAIIDETTWRRVTAKLADPARQQAAKRTTLLTGMVFCGKCGHGLTRNFIRSGMPVLSCRRRVGSDKGCNGIVVAANPLEKVIEDAVLFASDVPGLERATKRRADTTDDSVEVEIAEVEATLALRLEMLDAGELTRAEYLQSVKRLRARLEGLRRQQATTSKTLALVPYQGKPGLLRQRWGAVDAEGKPTMTVDEKRTILAALIDRVTIAPATHRGRGLDPDRVDIAWRV